MKTRIAIAALLLAACGLAFAGDNVTDTNVYKAGTGDNATLRTTESAGVHTPHVIVDSTPVTSNNGTTQTAATGTNWTALASHAAKQVTIINTTGSAIAVRYGTGTAISLPDGSGYTFRGLTDSNGLQVKRTDDSNTQVTVAWNYENW